MSIIDYIFRKYNEKLSHGIYPAHVYIDSFRSPESTGIKNFCLLIKVLYICGVLF
jgi:hypothetical protein